MPLVFTASDLKLLGLSGQVLRHAFVERQEPDAALFFSALRRAKRVPVVLPDGSRGNMIELTIPLPPCALRTVVHEFKPQLERALTPEARDVALLLVVCNAVLDATADA